MREDLNRYLDFAISIERRKRRAYVIEQVAPHISKYSCADSDRHFKKTKEEFSFCGDFKSLVTTLQKECAYDPMPIVDSSGYKGNINIEMKGKLNDIEFVKQMLARYGFKLVEKQVEVDILVFKDKNVSCNAVVTDRRNP
ncbi:MAG: hypothetical protein EOO10_19480 [Chitinophagaceae bacterium]|nr:MAG: hypothetical protein EOO10_19480 [Chitinophagaceae bacterium]